MKQFFVTLTLAAMLFLPMMAMVAPMPAQAQGDSNDLLWGDTRDDVQTGLGLGDTDPRIMAAQVINIILGFLGIIAVVIILLGGFKWMTAGGNEDGVSEAKKMIGAGVIGLIIVLAAFGIARFVLDALYDATGAGAV